MYPYLYRMALDYLSIPGKTYYYCKLGSSTECRRAVLATSVHVEHVFSQGHILLSHICSHLSVQSTHALMCLGVWSSMGYVLNSDIKATAIKPELLGDEKELVDGWDDI